MGRRTEVASIERITFSYGDHLAVDDVSLALFADEVFVLMGPNGAGKSSLIRLLTGALKPDAGRVTLPAPNGLGSTPIGLVPQEIALYPWLTARENCRAFARVAGLDRRTTAARVGEALRLSHCESVADRPISHLSGGNRRRANIAAALVSNPTLLVLDEPTVGVDVEARRAIAQTIESLKANGLSVLMITHDFDEAGGLADRVGFLVGGRLVAQGEPREMMCALFGQRKRIEIHLPHAPVERQRAALAARGATPTRQANVWTALRDLPGRWDAGSFAEELVASGLEIGELRLRDPGLECLYTRYCGITAAQ